MKRDKLKAIKGASRKQTPRKPTKIEKDKTKYDRRKAKADDASER